MSKNALISPEVVKQTIDKYNIVDFSKATIREVVAITNELEAHSDLPFIRMEMGVPGLRPSEIGTMAEIEEIGRAHV